MLTLSMVGSADDFVGTVLRFALEHPSQLLGSVRRE